MKTQNILFRTLSILIGVLALSFGCVMDGEAFTDAGLANTDDGDGDDSMNADSNDDDDAAGNDDDTNEPEPVRVTLQNEGGAMEGHTPRGFQGQGTGLFAGDNLNVNFPDGEGVQIFLSFEVRNVPDGEVSAARLFSDHGSVSGTPYADLGPLNVEEIEYDAFSSALFDATLTADGHQCILATSAAGPFECDIAPIVQRAIDDGRQWAQVRIRFESAGDNDGAQDLATFFITDSNTNEPGIFEVDVDVIPAE